MDFMIYSEGWRIPKGETIEVDSSFSSQFMSGLLLNTVDLTQSLRIKELQGNVSRPYLNMTFELLSQQGINIQKQRTPGAIIYQIDPHQQLKARPVYLQCDLSSAFSIAAFGLLKSEVIIENLPLEVPGVQCNQADQIFVFLLEKMGARIERLPLKNEHVRAYKFKLSKLKGLKACLKDSPDLFPVLAVLCAFAEGESELSGLTHLEFKESHRLIEIAGLLNRMGVQTRFQSEGLWIQGGMTLCSEFQGVFDPKGDHRLAMAAALIKSRFPKLQILNPECVAKSYPEFWKVIE
jgi:3-phosphoshikimate 1-carboxyvinyltransferase